MMRLLNIKPEWLLLIFVSLQVVLVPSVYSRTNTEGVSQSDQYIKNRENIMVKKMIAPEIEYKLSGLFNQYRKHTTDVEVVNDLNNNAAHIISYVLHRVYSDSQRLAENEVSELLMILSLLKHEKAIETFIEVASKYQNNTDISQKALMILRYLPPTKLISSYVNGLIENNRENTQLVRSALLYYLLMKDNTSLRWAVFYRSPGINPQLNFAGLALAAELINDDKVNRAIFDKLLAVPAIPNYQQYYLLKALYTGITEEEFNQVLPKMTIAPVIISELERLRDFDKASEDKKLTLAGYMLVSSKVDQQKIALAYFINEEKLSDVWKQMDTKTRLSAFQLANTMGYTIINNEGDIKPDSTGFLNKYMPLSQVIYLIIGAFVVAIFWIGFRYIKSSISKRSILKVSC